MNKAAIQPENASNTQISKHDYLSVDSARISYKETKETRNNLTKKLASFDTFGEAFNFKLPGGKATYQTLLGTCFTLAMGIILVMYGML